MALELKKVNIRANRLGEAVNSQALVEGEIALEGGAEAIARMLCISGRLVVGGVEALQDKVNMEGSVVFSLLYVGEQSGQVEGLEAACGFTHSVELAGLKAGGQVLVSGSVQDVQSEVVDGTVIRVRAIAELNCQPQTQQTYAVVSAVEGLPGLEVKQEQLTPGWILGTANETTTLRDEVTLPSRNLPIGKLLKSWGDASVTEITAMAGAVRMRGDVQLSLLYRCQDPAEPLQEAAMTLPFDYDLALPDSFMGLQTEGRADVQDLKVTAQFDEDGEMRVLQVECLLQMRANVWATQDLEVLQDAYAPNQDLEVSEQQITLSRPAVEQQATQLLKESLPLPEGMPNIGRISFLQATPCIADWAVTDQGLEVQGILTCGVLYESDQEEGGIEGFNSETPFSIELTLPERLEGEVDVSAAVDQSFGTVLSPTEMEGRFTLRFTVASYPETQVGAVDNIVHQGPSSQQGSGIVVAFVRTGDTLWSIARRYGVSLQSVLKLNPQLDPENLQPGDRVLLYRQFEPTAPTASDTAR